MSFKEGFNFRNTSGYVTDPADTQFVNHNTAYPTTANGVTFGWDADYWYYLWSEDDSTLVDPRLAGHTQPAGTQIHWFRVDLPSAGNYSVDLAMGDADYANMSRASVAYIKDNTSTIYNVPISGSGNVPAGAFVDAQGTEHSTAANWVSNHVAEELTFSTTTFYLYGGDGSYNHGPCFSHLSIEEVASGTDVTALPGSGSVSVQGYAPTAAATKNVTALPGAGSAATQGFAPTASASASVTAEPTAGAVSVQGYAPTASVAGNVTAEPGAGAVSVQGLAPTASTGVVAAPATGAVAVQGYAPAASASVVASPAAGLVAVQGQAPTASAGVVADPGAGAVAVQGYAPDVSVSVVASPDAGGVAAQGYEPEADASTSNVIAFPGCGTVTVRGFAPSTSASGWIIENRRRRRA